MDFLKVKNIKSGKIIYGFAKNQKKVVLKAKQNQTVVVYIIKDNKYGRSN